ncbi:unnamed protein product [Nippostrongylus brasiliensis]|uniref:Secreted protein n=1 Tax=Nippostrongylus brasiliensis TaxID=27835 RepID=A0A0N4YDW8_NIPBR|nr:hypothetical protein Q1695_001342 [Nippostrongylus brasiliensis]VDL78445.1 unnamed protein product [Nippostrongylus brasiliensis]
MQAFPLLLVAACLPQTYAFRVKRQYGPPQSSYTYQQWPIDQGSYQQSYAYQNSYSGTENYHPNTGYYNYYTQREYAPQQASNSWNNNGDNYPVYPNPYYSYYNQQRYESGVPPIPTTHRSPYARPDGITPNPVQPQPEQPPKDGYPQPSFGWESSSREVLAKKNDTIKDLPKGDQDLKTLTFFAREGFDEDGHFLSHGVVEVTKGGDEPTGSSKGSMKVNGIDEASNTRTTTEEPYITSSTTTSDEQATEPASTTEIHDGSNSANDDLVASAQFPPDDDKEQFAWVTSTQASDISPDKPTVPVDEFLPTEVPPATTESETRTSTSSNNKSTTAGSGDSSADSVLLRSPPLPKQVVDKLQELGFSVIKMFT